VLAATMVITVRNPVHAALFLVLSFFASSGLWLLLEAEFLAIALVLVYVGAVMVLFLFVVMMLDINLTVLREGFARYLPVGGIVAVLMFIAMAWSSARAFRSQEAVTRPSPTPPITTTPGNWAWRSTRNTSGRSKSPR
jgi:NADH-quinone oxidoreductase subunit J